MKKLVLIISLLAILLIAYFLGPSPETPVYTEDLPQVDIALSKIEQSIQQSEASLNLRENNGSSIVWANDSTSKTDYVFLYLHGFSASPYEGHPVHLMLADTFGSNLYLPRLATHGFREDQLEGFSAEKIWNSAVKALATAQILT